MNVQPIDEEAAYQAVRSRDTRFDGVFYFAVRTTGIYCRPSCPAVPARRRNISYHRSAAAAQTAGYRACRRCNPDAVPGSPEWNLRADVVGRAMRMISEGVVDREGVSGLASRLGYSTRQLNRQLTAELGAGPTALARARRTHTARTLLERTTLPVTDIAFAAGFASVRQFNDTIREVYARTPSELRRRQRSGRTATGVDRGAGLEGAAGDASQDVSEQRRERACRLVSIPLRLAVRYPFDADYVFGFLANHAVPGVEEYRPGVDGRPVYRRSLLLPNGWGVAELEPPSERAAADFSEAGRGWLDCRLHLSDLRDLAPAVQRLRDLGDLDADPLLIAERLGADPLLAPLAAARPGIRSLGQVEPAEEAVRAVVGQQIAVPAARTVLGRLAARYGTPLPRPFGGLTTHFPTVAQLAAAEPEHLPMPATRQRTLLALTGALAEGRLQLERGGDREEAEQRLLELPGIGPWTTGCVRMRGLADPDVFLGGDMVVRKALSAAGHPGDARTSTAAAEAWRPWRSYATNLLWAQAAHAAPGTAPATATPTAKRRKPQNHEQEQQA